jgi:hypothetical protein
MMCGVSEPAVTMLLLLLLWLWLLRTRPILVLCTRNVFISVIFIKIEMGRGEEMFIF